jgi:pSer/pThr/pTyr-binding forkhead associated (FHA) protein
LSRPSPPGDDIAELAAARSRDAFVAAYPHPFLVGDDALRQPRAGRPQMFESGNTFTSNERALATRDQRRRLVLPVRKTHVTFPSMITVGRTKNNDVVIADALMSKFHAFFRIVDDHHELADAGSQNGTRIGDRLLEPKGPAVRVRSGDVILFAQLRFRFVDAAACWDALRAH